ncbi:MAG TPA: hypothetical protein VEW28_03115 [Candidatus Kapabacteria bacterium]|nr:hypothetical protein [Candidatus Kapabacteria bacterium]
MIRNVFFAAIAVLTLALLGSGLFAQGSPNPARIAYTNSDRTMILAATVGSNKVDTLIQSTTSANPHQVFSLKRLAVLASTRDGKSLLIGCRVVFLNPNNLIDSISGFARLDSPFTLKGAYIKNFPVTKIGPLNMLRFYTEWNPLQPVKALPLGTLTPDETQWYATWMKVNPGDSVQFYHGNFDGSGGTDSVTLRGNDAAKDGYHMTNIITSADGNTMLVGICDGFPQGFPRMSIVAWNPSVAAGSYDIQLSNITAPVQALRPKWNIDSAFGFTLKHIDGSSPEMAEIGLIPNVNRDMYFYSFRISGTISNLSQTGDAIPASALPDSLHMFTGYTGNWSDLDNGQEVIVPRQGGPLGNGGDVAFSRGGDSVVFVTSRSDDYAEPAQSSIWIYDMSANKSYFVFNDHAQMERQPIFMGFVPKVAPYQRGTAYINPPTLSFPDTKTNGNSPLTASVIDTTANEVVITSTAITGADASAFSVSPTVPPNITVAGGSQSNFTVTFTPSAIRSYSAKLVIHYQDSLFHSGETDSVLSVNLTGNGIKNSVQAEAEAKFSMTVMPNPFSHSSSVEVTALDAGAVKLELVDITGKSVYQSGERFLGIGEKSVFTIDAQRLALAPGSYYIVLHTPAGDVMRKAIVIE